MLYNTFFRTKILTKNNSIGHYISTFNVYIKHRSGKLITHVDALSRNPVDHKLTVQQLIQLQANKDLSYIGQTVVRNEVQTIRVIKRNLAIILTNNVKTILENMDDYQTIQT